MTDLPGVFGAVSPYIDDYGYVAVALLVLLGNLGIPVPNEATVVVAAIYSVSDDLALLPVLLVCWTAAVLGESAAFAIGRYGGRPLAIRLGRRFGVTHDALDRVEGFYERRGSLTVAVGRFVPVLRRLNGLVAGVTAMSWQGFLISNAVGAAIWVGVWTTVGTQAGNHIEAVNTVLVEGAPVFGVVVVLGVIGYVLRRRARRRASAVVERHDGP